MHQYNLPQSELSRRLRPSLVSRKSPDDPAAIYLLALLPFGFFLTQDSKPSLAVVAAFFAIVLLAIGLAHKVMSARNRQHPR